MLGRELDGLLVFVIIPMSPSLLTFHSACDRKGGGGGVGEEDLVEQVVTLVLTGNLLQGSWVTLSLTGRKYFSSPTTRGMC